MNPKINILIQLKHELINRFVNILRQFLINFANNLIMSLLFRAEATTENTEVRSSVCFGGIWGFLGFGGS